MLSHREEKKINVYEVKFPSKDWHYLLIILGSVIIIMMLGFIIIILLRYWQNGEKTQISMQNKKQAWQYLGFGPALGLPQNKK